MQCYILTILRKLAQSVNWAGLRTKVKNALEHCGSIYYLQLSLQKNCFRANATLRQQDRKEQDCAYMQSSIFTSLSLKI